MQKLGTAFNPLIFKSCCNLSCSLDLIVFVIIVTHAHLQLLEASDGFVQLAREILASLFEINPRTFRAGYAIFTVETGDRAAKKASLAYK